MARFFCCGGAHLDFTARCKAAFVAGASNPVAVVSSIGGASLNTALNLKRLGNDVRLFSATGDDAAAARIQQSLRDEGLAIDGIVTRSGQRTAAYTAILDRGGDLVAGLADMEIYDSLSAADVLSALERDSRPPESGDFLFVDANLPHTVLTALIGVFRELGVTLCAAAVSPAKVGRLKELLPDLDVLFCNRAELAALCKLESEDEAGLQAAAVGLSETQGLRLLVTRGAEGAFAFEHGSVSRFPAFSARVIDVNGAGDAFAAGNLHALGLGQETSEAVALGQAAAAMTLEVSSSTVKSLSEAAVWTRLRSERMKVRKG